MANLQQIEQALIAINETQFQELCDEYLSFSDDSYTSISRPGSQKGKKKTKKGTPDAFWILPNGRYVFAEYTTQNRNDSKTAFLEKLKADVLKCLDKKVTGVEVQKIQKIILCFNSEINTKEIEAVKKLVEKTYIKLEFKSIDTIARDTFSRYQYIAKTHLQLQIDTGQILPPEIFTKEYAAGSGLTTPLDNTFYFREQELENIKGNLATNEIVILTGPPGVGKSKLALTAIGNWKKEQKNFEIFCISNKNVEIFEDIKSYLKSGRNYILMIDDANRQSQNFLQILGFVRSHTKGEIKIIITVRDYALEYIRQKCSGYNFSVVSIQGFTDEQIKEILAGPDFEVTNPPYVKRLLEIANGNPRIAIMAARMAIKSQRLEKLYDLFDFYDKYFQTFISDNALFGDSTLLKVIGLLSFFYSIDRSDKELYSRILTDFRISDHQFTESVGKLESLELLESSEDNSTITIADQVLSTYLFFKLFIKDNTLDFKILIFNYFDTHRNRFSESVISSSNDFGYTTVLKRIDHTISDYLRSVSTNGERSLSFFGIFWFLKPEEALAFVYQKIIQIPVVEDPTFILEKKNNNINWDKDEYLKLLFNFYYHAIPSTISALELTFEYISRKPTLFEEVHKKISDTFSFSYEDERYSFARQKILTDFLIKNAKKKNAVGLSMFLHLFPELLKTSYRIFSGSRKRQAISFYEYRLPVKPIIKSIREKLWKHLDRIYQLNKFLADEAVYGFITPSIDNSEKEILALDLPYMIDIVAKHFQPEIFLNCYYVQKMAKRFTKMGLSDSRIEPLVQNFYSRKYKWYKLIDWHQLRSKEEHEYEILDYDKFERLKEIELRYKFRFSKINQFREFYKVFEELSSTPHIQSWSFHQSLDVIIHETYLHNKKLGYNCLKEIQKANKTGYGPVRIFHPVNENGLLELQTFFTLISVGNYERKPLWVVNFLEILKPEFVSQIHIETLLSTYHDSDEYLYFNFGLLEKFFSLDKDIFHKVLKIAVQKLEQKKRVQLDFHFFENYLHYFSKNLSLPKKAYLLCDSMDNSFDHDCKDLFELVKLDKSFFLEYLKWIGKDKFSLSSREYSNLARIWELDYAEELVYSAIEFLAGRDYYYASEDFATAFFKSINAIHKERSKFFLKTYIKRNMRNSKKINIILDIYRNCFFTEYHKVIPIILRGNGSIDFFKKLDLVNSSYFGSARVNFSDQKADNLENILSVINKLPNSYKYIQHQSLLKARILNERKNAQDERRRDSRRNSW
ncbi:MAG: hypothetical protein JWP81_1561 [Ferruginibacter sp.]|nr:hypothetical protein [Ferruginibacter sp.]